MNSLFNTPFVKLFVLISFSSFVLFSCGGNTSSQSPDNETTEETSEVEKTETEATPPPEEMEETAESEASAIVNGDYNTDDFIGYYVGGFVAMDYDYKKNGTYMNKINISIDRIDGDKVIGHSVVAGNSRPFDGVLNLENLNVYAAEPGDDKYDGTFSFTIDKSGNKIKGTWTANDKKLNVTERKYELEKKEFSYDKSLNLPEELGWTDLYDPSSGNEYVEEGEFLTEGVTKFNASTTELKPEDLENMYKGDLEIIRNSIYARHGYSFKNRKIRYVFNYIDWYIPVSTDVREAITDLEWKNIELIKRYEQHADRYYDSFGR